MNSNSSNVTLTEESVVHSRYSAPPFPELAVQFVNFEEEREKEEVESTSTFNTAPLPSSSVKFVAEKERYD